MALRNPSVNFYDSDFDSRNESTIFDDRNESTIFDNLNVAFIESPEESISSVLDDLSLNDPAGMLVCDDEKVKDQKVKKLAGERDRVELSCQGNYSETEEEAFRSGLSLESDLGPHSLTSPWFLCNNGQNWISTSKRNRMPRFADLDSEIGSIQFSEISKTADLLKKKKERTECLFASTCLEEFQKTSAECDWRKIEKRSFFEMDDESEKMEPNIRVPVSLSDHVYHELSTIPEVDSMLMDESVELLINSDKCDGSFRHGLRNIKILKENDSFDICKKANAPSNFPSYVMKLIQNEHIEKLLREPGILEESDLTLITTDLESLSKVSEISTRAGHCNSYYNFKRFDEEESPSLMSFEQHELSCMRDCLDE